MDRYTPPSICIFQKKLMLATSDFKHILSRSLSSNTVQFVCIYPIKVCKPEHGQIYPSLRWNERLVKGKFVPHNFKVIRI